MASQRWKMVTQMEAVQGETLFHPLPPTTDSAAIGLTFSGRPPERTTAQDESNRCLLNSP